MLKIEEKEKKENTTSIRIGAEEHLKFKLWCVLHKKKMKTEANRILMNEVNLDHTINEFNLKAVCELHMKLIDKIRGNENYNFDSPRELIKEIRRLEPMKSDFEIAIRVYSHDISLKDSYTRYRMFVDEIIKDLREKVRKTDFIDDLIDLKAEEIEKEFIKS